MSKPTLVSVMITYQKDKADENRFADLDGLADAIEEELYQLALALIGKEIETQVLLIEST